MALLHLSSDTFYYKILLSGANSFTRFQLFRNDLCVCVCVLGYLLAIHSSLEKFRLRCLCVSERFEENVLLKKSYSNNSLISVTYSYSGEEA